MKRKSLIMVLLVTFCCVMVASCSFSNAKYVMGVEKNDVGDIVVTYSDGTTSTVTGIKGETGATGAVGPVGPKGDTGEKGEAGIDAKDLEFRYYKNKLWYRVIGTTTWKVTVTKVELDQEDLTYEDFLCSLYVKEKDFSLTVSTFASVNGAWCESKIAGNVLTVTTKASDGSNVYYDLVKTGEEFKLVTYATEGVNETEVDYTLNDSMDSFVGTYTIVDEAKNSYVVVVGASSVQFKVGAKTTYMGSYMKGSMLYCFDRSSKATIAISMVDGEASFVTKLDDGTGNFVELSKYVVTKWVDVSKLIGVYTLYVDGVEAFDFALKANNSLNLYDGKYPQYTYNVDTATFDQTGVSYHIQYTDAGFVCSSSVEGKVITVKKWDNYIGQLKKFATVDSSEVETNWIINDFGGVTKDGKYFGSAVQKKNVVTLSTTSSKESLVVTYADGKFSGKYTINGTTFTDVTIKLDATIEDFLGSYKVTFDYSGRESIVEFVIGPNPYSEGNYAFIIGENPMSYTLDAGKRTLTYINQRSGTGYRVTSNLDGSKSVISFSIGEGNVINETTIVSGVVEFKKLSE